jgi:hypothetical protein
MSIAVYYDPSTEAVTAVNPSEDTPKAAAKAAARGWGVLINPDLSAVQGQPQAEWRVSGGVVTHDPAVGLPPLADYAEARRLQEEADCWAFVSTRYSSAAQMALNTLHGNAQGRGRTNRRDYIAPAFDWVEAALTEYASTASAIAAAVDHATVDAITPIDWNAWLAANPDPGITIGGALSIAD